MTNDDEYPPPWLWNLARGSFVILVIAISVLIVAVVLGAGNPQPNGTLKWEDRLEKNMRWQIFEKESIFGSAGLTIPFNQKNDVGGMVTPVNTSSPFTIEAAAAQVAGESGAWYGIVFNYYDSTHYTTIMVNGNGYVEIVEKGGKVLLAQQEWPNIQLAQEANRIRLDVSNGIGIIRINDEILSQISIKGGQVGIVARSSAAAQQVRFYWVKLWSR